MTKMRPPQYSTQQAERPGECAAVCAGAVSYFIKCAVDAGWGEEEIALSLADAADNFVVELARAPKRRFKAANNN
ncbi:hypothetical protein AX760_25590 [Pararhizobium antarcticum]|uniref:Uncharacterized protein n=1 Tax=Pararhizobium antarcticum TaxID=1798805 RepID=A0A657LWL3_9HYPH|nr:hypothetical protein AX760_25590 [Pararhizobium antarcticum]OJG00661.1 hypothetical protein AX761_24475 [Rhizobium sp. 58]